MTVCNFFQYICGFHAEVLNHVYLMQHGLQEAIQFCDLMITGPLEDILDVKKRVESYPNLNLHHVLALLKKFR